MWRVLGRGHCRAVLAPVVRVPADRPPDDRLSREKRLRERFAIAGARPKLLARESAAQGPRGDAAQRGDKGRIEPDHELHAPPRNGTRARVVAVEHPAWPRRRVLHFAEQLLITGLAPARLPEQRVHVVTRQAEHARELARKGGFPAARSANYVDPLERGAVLEAVSHLVIR